MPGDTLHFQFEALDLESGLYIRNSAGCIVKYNARVMDFGELALGCIEADFSKQIMLQHVRDLQDFRTSAPLETQTI